MYDLCGFVSHIGPHISNSNFENGKDEGRRMKEKSNHFPNDKVEDQVK